MVTVGHHMDAVVAQGKVFIFALIIIVVTDTETVVGVNLEVIHFLMVGLVRQIVHLVFVERVGSSGWAAKGLRPGLDKSSV